MAEKLEGRDEIINRINELEKKEESLYKEGVFSQGDVKKQTKINNRQEKLRSILENNPKKKVASKVDRQTGETVKVTKKDDLDQFQEKVEKKTDFNASDVEVTQTDSGTKFSVEDEAVKSKKEKQKFSQKMGLKEKTAKKFNVDKSNVEVSKINGKIQAELTKKGKKQVIENRTTDIGTLVNPTKGNPNQNLSQELLTAGVDLMQEGQDFGKTVAQNLSFDKAADVARRKAESAAEQFSLGTSKQRDRFFDTFETSISSINRKTSGFSTGLATGTELLETARTGDQSNLVDVAKTASPTFQTQAERDVAESVLTGVGTGPTQFAGLATATAGAVPLALRKDTPGLGKGAVKGATLTAQQVSDNPSKFVAQETGEEIGEAITTGGLALATPAFSPDVTPELDSIDLTKTRKGQVGISTDSSTPDFVRDSGPEVIQDKTQNVDQTKNVVTSDVEKETLDISTETDTGFLETGTGAKLSGPTAGSSVLAQSPVNAEANPRGDTDILSDTVADSQLGNALDTQTGVDAVSESDVAADVAADAQTETQIETQPEIFGRSEPELEQDTTPDLNLGEENNKNQGSSLLTSEEEETVFRGSVGAEVLGITAEKKPSRTKSQNPLNLRPVIEDQNEL